MRLNELMNGPKCRKIIVVIFHDMQWGLRSMLPFFNFHYFRLPNIFVPQEIVIDLHGEKAPRVRWVATQVHKISIWCHPKSKLALDMQGKTLNLPTSSRNLFSSSHLSNFLCNFSSFGFSLKAFSIAMEDSLSVSSSTSCSKDSKYWGQGRESSIILIPRNVYLYWVLVDQILN